MDELLFCQSNRKFCHRNTRKPGSTVKLVLPSLFTDPGFSLACGVLVNLADDCEAAPGQSGVHPSVHPA